MSISTGPGRQGEAGGAGLRRGAAWLGFAAPLHARSRLAPRPCPAPRERSPAPELAVLAWRRWRVLPSPGGVVSPHPWAPRHADIPDSQLLAWELVELGGLRGQPDTQPRPWAKKGFSCSTSADTGAEQGEVLHQVGVGAAPWPSALACLPSNLGRLSPSQLCQQPCSATVCLLLANPPAPPDPAVPFCPPASREMTEAMQHISGRAGARLLWPSLATDPLY